MKNIKDVNKTLCILANSKVGDMYGKKIVEQLKKRYDLHDIRLLGNGGYCRCKIGSTLRNMD